MIQQYFTYTPMHIPRNYDIQLHARNENYDSFVTRDAYFRHSGLVWGVNEFWRIIVDVGHSHNHWNRPFLVGQLHCAAQLKNKRTFV